MSAPSASWGEDDWDEASDADRRQAIAAVLRDRDRLVDEVRALRAELDRSGKALDFPLTPADRCRESEGMTGIDCAIDDGDHELPHRGWWRHETDETGEFAVYIEWPVPERPDMSRPRATPQPAVPLPAVPGGGDEPDWHNMRERLHTEISAIVGVGSREDRTGDADGDLIERVRRAVAAPTDGEDVPARLAAARDRLLRHYLAKTASRIALPDQARRVTPTADVDEIESVGEAVLAELERLRGGPSQPDARDVVPRLYAAAAALSDAEPMSCAGGDLFGIAVALGYMPVEVRAAVAAALARPTERER